LSHDENTKRLASPAAVLVPAFGLHLVAGIESRAGPPHTPLYTQLRRASLLGRAPPRFA
jgi:hypothetical protein